MQDKATLIFYRKDYKQTGKHFLHWFITQSHSEKIESFGKTKRQNKASYKNGFQDNIKALGNNRE